MSKDLLMDKEVHLKVPLPQQAGQGGVEGTGAGDLQKIFFLQGIRKGSSSIFHMSGTWLQMLKCKQMLYAKK